jgi:protein-S-isoprenylcysteine O-methyltransferase Ste14
MRIRVIPPPLLFVVTLGSGAAVQHFRPRPIAPYSFAAGMLAGSVLLLLAATVGIWALVKMRRVRTPVEPWEEPRVLVTSGPFRVTRNPLYVSLTMVHAALAVTINSAWLAAATVLLPLLIDRLVIRREEVVLAGVFGPQYEAYRDRVRRWL